MIQIPIILKLAIAIVVGLFHGVVRMRPLKGVILAILVFLALADEFIVLPLAILWFGAAGLIYFGIYWLLIFGLIYFVWRYF